MQDILALAPPIMEEIAAAVRLTPHERGHVRIGERSPCLQSWRKSRQLSSSHMSAVNNESRNRLSIHLCLRSWKNFQQLGRSHHERVQVRIAEQNGNMVVPLDDKEIAEVIQLTPREIQQMKERIAKCCDDPVRPN